MTFICNQCAKTFDNIVTKYGIPMSEFPPCHLTINGKSSKQLSTPQCCPYGLAELKAIWEVENDSES